MNQLCRQTRANWQRAATASGTWIGMSFAVLSRSLGQLGLGDPAPATSLRNEADALVWYRTDVDGRMVVYGAGGTGPPVLFLHGWGLGSHAYKRALRRLTARGSAVYAPAMPGFGGSDAMPLSDMTIEAYADWAASFLDTLEIDEPALVIGHSFGGGVATALAHAHPEKVRYLVLLNAVGGATWDGRGGRSLAERPLDDWLRGFASDFQGITGLEMLGAISRDLITNLATNPLVLAKAGILASQADLTEELATLRENDVPVLALTAEADEVIPSAAFEALCEQLGAEGHVVRGGHTWILADPDHFASVLRNVVDVEVAEHHASTATDVASQIRELLIDTKIPKSAADALVAEAPPLWLLSDAPSVLAGDLALCHPSLGDGEVRAVARPLTGSRRLRLTVVAPDRPGLLADTAAVLTIAGVDVVGAGAMTWPSGVAVHALVIEPEDGMRDDDFGRLGDQLRAAMQRAPEPDFEPRGVARVEVSGLPRDRATVTVTAQDQLGLLWAICRWFADHGVNIEAVHATTTAGVARDTFVVVGACDPEELGTHLSHLRRGHLLRT